MYPTKMTDDEPHRTNHLKRHAKVLDAVAASKEHAGSFGWCMADYNTHRDFGSGDQICYHGVLDIFRNKKPVLIEALEGAWGDKSKGYRLEGYKGDTPVKTVLVEKFEKLDFFIETDTLELIEGKTYDVASVR